jgi:hypothetical protein
MSTRTCIRLWIIILLIASVSTVDAQVTEVWAVGDGEKIFRYTADHFDRLENSIWNGETIELRGLRNDGVGSAGV